MNLLLQEPTRLQQCETAQEQSEGQKPRLLRLCWRWHLQSSETGVFTAGHVCVCAWSEPTPVRRDGWSSSLPHTPVQTGSTTLSLTNILFVFRSTNANWTPQQSLAGLRPSVPPAGISSQLVQVTTPQNVLFCSVKEEECGFSVDTHTHTLNSQFSSLLPDAPSAEPVNQWEEPAKVLEAPYLMLSISCMARLMRRVIGVRPVPAAKR